MEIRNRNIWLLLVPPLAVCRFGCAGCCAAPIAVFWGAGIVSFVYGFFGGPVGVAGISYGTLSFGAVLWGIAVIWADTVIRNAERQPDRCRDQTSTLCRTLGNDEETDPLETARKIREGR